MRKVVGIDRKIKRAWVDAVLDRLTQTTDEADLRTFLDKLLKDELPGKESRAKSTGIVLRVWSGIPPERIALRDRAVALLPRISGQERIWLHWGMTALAYPFFRDTAEVVGRLLALQDDFTTAQVQARMLTTWGDRATSKEAAQKLITTLVDWEVLRSTKTKGHFLLARKMTASIPELQLWLLEALLAASEADEIEAQQLLRLPESFPFTISIGVADLRRYEGFNIHRQGLDMDMVALRKVKVEPPPRPTKKPKAGKKASQVGPGLFDKLASETASDNGQPSAAPVVPVAHQPNVENHDETNDQRRVEDSIKNEVLRTLSDRASRFLQVRGTVLVPFGPFSAPSVECAELFRDGHYLGCIALTQAVMEAVIRHVWQITLKKKPNQQGDFEKNLESLHKKAFISDEWKTKLDKMWADRHSFHHLRPSVESDPQKLEEIARSTLNLLNDLEREFFGFSVREGMIVPDHAEYWLIKDGESLVYVRGSEHA
ncbi:MAG: hypothetical protein AB7I37_06385 [Pirellulales bacterium]